MSKRIPAREMAKELVKHLRNESPDYNYLRSVFKNVRDILDIQVTVSPKKLPDVPNESEVEKYYEEVWKSQNLQDMVIIKTFLYTGIRVGELVQIRLADVDFDSFQIRINEGKGKKDRIVPFPTGFREILAMHMQSMRQKNAKFLFESSWKQKYTDRGVRKILSKYADRAGINRQISPHRLRHFLLTWLKKKGVDDAMIQPYSGHATRQSLEVYSKLSITDAQGEYNEIIGDFPVK